jgi:hypothetical protein
MDLIHLNRFLRLPRSPSLGKLSDTNKIEFKAKICKKFLKNNDRKDTVIKSSDKLENNNTKSLAFLEFKKKINGTYDNFKPGNISQILKRTIKHRRNHALSMQVSHDAFHNILQVKEGINNIPRVSSEIINFI